MIEALLNQMTKIKPKDAFNHPKWKMGKKISIDSASLMNKMFEMVEAQKLFSIDLNKIDIVIHPFIQKITLKKYFQIFLKLV